ncbi:XVIPCD domain-containing protein [Ottowia sp.]|uniref:XVIPCD domain-containing protein n=1 Tax=Ottowia sp. TaxID=1898956 RepID=UPI003A897982
MRISSQDYANLADDAYKAHPIGVFSDPSAAPKATIGGIEYLIRAHVDNPKTGYQGTVYQRADTGEMVVAHRGTEFDREPFKDGARADAGMVLTRANSQANDAIALTGKALEIADQDRRKDFPSGPVTVTGHSLGGTLAQVSAHHFDLHGETFNAYGAASLNRRIPEGGDSVVNHVMAGDVVSAASPHFGQVRVYARPQEVETLGRNGYDNRTHWSDAMRGYTPLNVVTGTTPPNTTNAAIKMGGSHSMHHFTSLDAEGQPDRSVLDDSQSRALAQQQAVQIGEYRKDVQRMRGVLTAVSRGLGGNVRDAIDTIRGPLPPGAHAQQERPQAALEPTTFPPFQLSESAQRLVEDIRTQVQRVAGQHRLPWDQGLENTVFALASRAQDQGLARVTHLHADGGHVRMAEYDGLTLKEAQANTRVAANTPVEQSLQRLAQSPEPQLDTSLSHHDALPLPTISQSMAR